MPRPLVGHVVSHTHWDRAWYRTFEQNRARLLDVLDDLLALMARDRGYRHFVLDGQLAMVLDYLELRPERRDELALLARSGRLLLGPFFVLPDLFIPSGESLVRNLQLGRRAAAALGPVMKLGYLPDSFGHPAQLPQILAGFGIDGMLFARGAGDEPVDADFFWESPDGSRVLATHQIGGGYCNLARLGQRDDGELDVELAVETTTRVAAEVLAGSPHGELLLNNGCDHLPAQPELPALLRALNRRALTVDGRRLRLVHSTPVAYQRAVRRAIRAGAIRPAVHRGELRGSRCANILSGTLSSRVDLKLRHDACEQELLRWAEPWSAIAGALGVGRDDRALIDHAWRLLLLCQAHDDICGCSIDEVHAEDQARMARVEQVAREVRDRALAALASLAAGATALAFNPHPWPVVARVVTGGEAFLARLPPLGLCAPVSCPARGAPTARRWRSVLRLENGVVRAELDPAGRISVEGPTRQRFRVGLVDEGDAGDTYDSSPVSRQRVRDLDPARADQRGLLHRLRVDRDAVTVGATLDGQMFLPCDLTRDRRHRRTARPAPVTLRALLTAGSPLLELDIAVTNNVEDHRLRLALRAPFVAGEIIAGAPLGVTRRPVRRELHPDWHQPPAATQPFQDHVALQGPRGGVAVLAPGLREVEARHVRGGTELLITLLRSVLWLSRDDLRTRRGHAGPETMVLDATLQQTLSFRLALYPFAGRWEDAEVARRAAEHAAPPYLLVLGPSEASTPLSRSLLSLEPATVILSSLVAGPDGSLDARLVNLGERPVRARVAGPFRARARRLRLDGRPQGSVSLDDVPLRAAEILTLRLILAPRDR
jgi:hypothetical protein